MRISVSGIGKRFGSNRVLRDVDLEIASGSFTTILGVSGCGKTTLLRIIAGLEDADEGTVDFDGSRVFSASEGLSVPAERRGLGFVFQDFALWPHLTVFENVAFGLRSRKRTAGLSEAVARALEAVRLGGYEKRYPHQLSGGQQQRVAFARAIAVDPACILFDEPLSALDAVLRDELREELRELVARKRTTAVFVTHDQTEAMSLSSAVVVMDGGRVIQHGPPEQVYARPANRFVGNFVGRSNWIGDAHLVRPEHVELSPAEGARKFRVEVVGSAFMGNAYLVSIRNESVAWSMYSVRRIAVGESLDVFVRPENIVPCASEV